MFKLGQTSAGYTHLLTLPARERLETSPTYQSAAEDARPVIRVTLWQAQAKSLAKGQEVPQSEHEPDAPAAAKALPADLIEMHLCRL